MPRSATRYTSVNWEMRMYTVSQKNMPSYFCPYLRQILTDLKKFFHWHSLRKICNKVVINYPTTHELRRCTTLWNINVSKPNNSCSQFVHTATFRTLQKVRIKIAANGLYDAEMCYTCLWIPDVLNAVFVAGLPGLIPVYQQWSVVTFSSVRACFGLPLSVPSVGAFCFPNLFQ